jgi:hypothetical protein
MVQELEAQATAAVGSAPRESLASGRFKCLVWWYWKQGSYEYIAFDIISSKFPVVYWAVISEPVL